MHGVERRTFFRQGLPQPSTDTPGTPPADVSVCGDPSNRCSSHLACKAREERSQVFTARRKQVGGYTGIKQEKGGVAVPSPMQCSCTHTLQTSLLRQSSPLVTAHFLLLLVTCPGHLLPALRGGATRSHCCSSIQHGHIPAPPCCNSTLLYLTE